MALIFLKFIICAVVIFYCGKRVAKYGDAIAEKTGLSGLWIGVILVSIATSLPELFTGVGSTLFVNAPDLTVGNLFGANTYNLVNIALLDFFHKGSPLLSSVSSGQLLTLVLSAIPLIIAATGIFLSNQMAQLSILNISLYSFAIFAVYLISTKTIFKYEQGQQILDKTNKQEEAVFKYENISLKTASIRYALAALVIASAGIWLAYIGEDLARVLSLEKNFVGSLFLGFATTLPEITVSVAAIRIGAKELAVANMVGSNLFNMTIIGINDVLYQKAPIFQVISQHHVFTAFIVILMTMIVCAGLILKPKEKTRFGISVYAIALVAMFLLGTYMNFVLSR